MLFLWVYFPLTSALAHPPKAPLLRADGRRRDRRVAVEEYEAIHPIRPSPSSQCIDPTPLDSYNLPSSFLIQALSLSIIRPPRSLPLLRTPARPIVQFDFSCVVLRTASASASCSASISPVLRCAPILSPFNITNIPRLASSFLPHDFRFFSENASNRIHTHTQRTACLIRGWQFSPHISCSFLCSSWPCDRLLQQQEKHPEHTVKVCFCPVCTQTRGERPRTHLPYLPGRRRPPFNSLVDPLIRVEFLSTIFVIIAPPWDLLIEGSSFPPASPTTNHFTNTNEVLTTAAFPILKTLSRHSMAALVQSYPQSSSTVTMLQTRPSSASGILQNSSPSQSHHQYPTNTSHVQRNSFHGLNNGMGVSNYRGQTAVAPIAPYAFTSTPSLSVLGQRSQSAPHLQPQQRTSSAPIIPTVQQPESSNNNAPRSRYPAAASVSTTSSGSSELSTASQKSGSRDDSGIVGTARVASGAGRPLSTVITSSSGNLAPPGAASPVKTTPDRYRRPNNRRADSATTSSPSTSQTPPAATSSAMPNVMQFYGGSTQPAMTSMSSFDLQMPQFSKPAGTLGTAADDMQLHRISSSDQAKRYRRRSIHTIDVGGFSQGPTGSSLGFLQQGSREVSSADGRIDQQGHPLRSSPIVTIRPASSQGRNGSSESVNSTRSSQHSRPSSANKRESNISMAPANPASASASTPTKNLAANVPKDDTPKLVNIPPRGSSADAGKRIGKSSPLSKPMTMSPEPSASKDSFASAVNAALQQPAKPTYAQVVNGANANSPAAQQLAALNDKDSKKSKTSRLRRAFSFGSAAELRRASAENSAANNAASANAAERAKLRKDKYQDEQDAEQARIAEQQEAGGIGSGIYSGQGRFFSGSTDNLSISSTASSASVMIRKMGKGMKKSTRSLVGLFRPKSVIGVPAADSALPEVSQAQVSMVTVEAEREKVNINASPHDQVGGGTGFPRLERNSLDAVTSAGIPDRLGSSSTNDSAARPSIVGGEKERAEVLAAVKKGILKRTGTDSGNSSPVIRPLDQKSPNFQLPQIPNVNESPNSSAPSTPNDENQGHRRTGSVTLGGEDYFMSALRFRGDSKSVPNTPQGASKRNATFSPRIQFHDTWPSGEYDRRGEIATCNRLTPMLAQQIKEELNTFKMEMEVHENSKIYTHFF